MTTTDSSFIADGIATGIGPRTAIGFYAKAQTQRPSALGGPFTVGTFAVGNLVGIYGATDGTQPTPGVHAGVEGKSPVGYGVVGECEAAGDAGVGGFGGPWADGVVGVSGYQSGVVGTTGGNGWPSLPTGYVWEAGVSGQSVDHPAVVGFSVTQYAFQGVSTNSTAVLGVAGDQGPVPTLVSVAGIVGSSDQQVGIIGTSNEIGVYAIAATPIP